MWAFVFNCIMLYQLNSRGWRSLYDSDDPLLWARPWFHGHILLMLIVIVMLISSLHCFLLVNNDDPYDVKQPWSCWSNSSGLVSEVAFIDRWSWVPPQLCSQLYEILICSPLPRSVTIRAQWAVDRIWRWILGKRSAPPFTCQALISLRSSLSTKMLLSIGIFIWCIFFTVFWYKFCICSMCIYILIRWDWKHPPNGRLGASFTMLHDGFPKDSGKRSFHPAENYDGIKESVVTVDVDGEMVQASPQKWWVGLGDNPHSLNTPMLFLDIFSIYQAPCVNHQLTKNDDIGATRNLLEKWRETTLGCATSASFSGCVEFPPLPGGDWPQEWPQGFEGWHFATSEKTRVDSTWNFWVWRFYHGHFDRRCL